MSAALKDLSISSPDFDSSRAEHLPQHFTGVISPLAFCFLASTGGSTNFELIYSNYHPPFHKKNYSLYELPAVVRAVSLKHDLITEEVAVAMMEQEDVQEFCLILTWSELIKKVAIINLTAATTFVAESFAREIKRQKPKFEAAFTKEYLIKKSL